MLKDIGLNNLDASTRKAQKPPKITKKNNKKTAIKSNDISNAVSSNGKLSHNNVPYNYDKPELFPVNGAPKGTHIKFNCKPILNSSAIVNAGNGTNKKPSSPKKDTGTHHTVKNRCNKSPHSKQTINKASNKRKLILQQLSSSVSDVSVTTDCKKRKCERSQQFNEAKKTKGFVSFPTVSKDSNKSKKRKVSVPDKNESISMVPKQEDLTSEDDQSINYQYTDKTFKKNLKKLWKNKSGANSGEIL